MPTNLAIDDRLLEEAVRLGKHPIFSTDADFAAFARHVPIALHAARA